MERPALAAILLLLAPCAALGGSPSQALDIPVEEWRAMASGRTVTYRIDGDLWALEHYFRGTDRVQLQLHDGTCLDGTWDYQAPHYCFHWGGQGTSCFRHARLGSDILVIEASGAEGEPMTQTMSAVSDTPLSCGPAGIS